MNFMRPSLALLCSASFQGKGPYSFRIAEDGRRRDWKTEMAGDEERVK
jgi:hypothetical protein